MALSVKAVRTAFEEFGAKGLLREALYVAQAADAFRHLWGGLESPDVAVSDILERVHRLIHGLTTSCTSSVSRDIFLRFRHAAVHHTPPSEVAPDPQGASAAGDRVPFKFTGNELRMDVQQQQEAAAFHSLQGQSDSPCCTAEVEAGARVSSNRQMCNVVTSLRRHGDKARRELWWRISLGVPWHYSSDCCYSCVEMRLCRAVFVAFRRGYGAEDIVTEALEAMDHDIEDEPMLLSMQAQAECMASALLDAAVPAAGSTGA